MKKTVHFVGPAIRLVKGQSAILSQTLDHPDLPIVRQTDPDNCIITTPVVQINEDGSFETRNTLYKPLKQLNG